ncbi:MAG: phosphatase PAP2 family protein [Methanothrix sp.]|nr:phosphatase PAP2 family protein [Methanothrix sp.]
MNRNILLAFVLLLLLALLLSYAAARFPILPFDMKSYEELQEQASPHFDEIMRWISALGELSIAMALTAIAMLTFALRRQWLEAIFILATISSVLLVLVLKDLVQRSRPFPSAENASGFIQSIDQYSYPSGHVLFFVVFFGFFAYLAWIHFTGWVRMIVIAICGALIVLIGPSRIFLGAHWASDVFGSYIIGTLWLFVLIVSYQWAIRRKYHDLEANPNYRGG